MSQFSTTEHSVLVLQSPPTSTGTTHAVSAEHSTVIVRTISQPQTDWWWVDFNRLRKKEMSQIGGGGGGGGLCTFFSTAPKNCSIFYYQIRGTWVPTSYPGKNHRRAQKKEKNEFAQIFTEFLPELSPNLPEICPNFARILTSAFFFFGGGGGPVSYAYDLTCQAVNSENGYSYSIQSILWNKPIDCQLLYSEMLIGYA